LAITSNKKQKKEMKTYFILYKNGQEQKIEATSLRATSALISFFRDEEIVLVISASEISRVGESKFSPLDMERPRLGAGREEIEKWAREMAVPLEIPRPQAQN
jgi:hypothetical protein